MKKLVLLVAVLSIAVFVSGVMAQQKPTPAPTPAAAPALAEKAEPAKMETFSGMVDKVDESARTITIKGEKEEKTFTTDDMTKITTDGKAMMLGDLKSGMNVSVQYRMDGDKMVASKVMTAAPKIRTRSPMVPGRP